MVRVFSMGRSYPRRSGAVVLLICTALINASPAFGQQYKTVAAKITGTPSQAQAAANRVLRQAGAPSDADKKALDAYFNYLFASMTSTDPISLGQLSDNRLKFYRTYLSAKLQPAAREHLLNVTLRVMGLIAKDNYHPAVRYNAALIIGQLDAEPAQPGGAASPPLPAATTELVNLLENDAFNNVPVPAAVKVAALVGLQRHAQAAADPQLADRIAKATLAIATRPGPPEDVSTAAYDWMRRLAVRVLATLQAKGLSPEAYQAVAKLVADKKVKLDERCGIAEAIEAPMYDGAQGLDRKPMAAAIATLARDVFAEEGKLADEYLEKAMEDPSMLSAPGGSGFSRGPSYGRGEMSRGGGMGFDLSMTMEPQGPKFEKRRLLDRTLAVATAADALATGASDDVKTMLTDLSTAIKGLADEAVKKDATDAEVASRVVDLQSELKTLVADWLPDEAPADEPAEAEAAFAPEDEAEAAEPPAAEAPAPAAARAAAPEGGDAPPAEAQPEAPPAAADAGAEAPAAEAPAPAN